MSVQLGIVARHAVPVRPVDLNAAPSGQALDLIEVLLDEVGAENWVRFRFLAPAIGSVSGGLSFDAVALDFEHLCQHVALPYLEEFHLTADVVSITLLDREIPFGASDPDATQYIEVFRVDTGACVWEGL